MYGKFVGLGDFGSGGNCLFGLGFYRVHVLSMCPAVTWGTLDPWVLEGLACLWQV